MSTPPASSAGAAEAAAPPLERTLRALAFGCLFGGVLAIGNTYLGLKTGWWDPAGITTVLVSFAFFRGVGRLGARGRGPFSILENSITQTAATAASSMPAAIGFLGAVPALAMLGRKLSPVELGLWGTALGVLGILLAVPLRQRLIVARDLPFPAGTAVAEVTRTLYAEGGDAQHRTRTLVGSGLASAAVAWLRDGRPQLIPAEVMLPGAFRGVPCSSLTLGISLSPMLLAVGMLIGPLLGASLLAGAVLAWGVAAPALLRAGVVRSAQYGEIVSWLLWPGVTLMVAGAFTSLLSQLRVLGRGLGAFGELGGGRATRIATTLAALAVAVLTWRLFGASPLHVVIVVPLSIVLSLMVCQASGETGIAPLLSAGQITQVVGGLTGHVTAAADIAGGAIASGLPAETAQNLDSFKAGRMLGSSPRHQLVAMFVGAIFGGIVAVPAYAVITQAWAPGSPELPAPFAFSWKAMGELAESGTAALPPYAAAAAAAAFVAGVLLTLLQNHPRWSRYALSPMAIGIGFVVPATMPAGLFIGSLLVVALRRYRPAWAEHHIPTLASGAISGESLTGVAAAVLRVIGIVK